MNHTIMGMQIPQFDDANCLTVGDPDLFFHNGKEKNQKEQIKAAKKICQSCVHKMECREFALEHQIPYGVWGGVSEAERRRIVKREKIQVTETLEEALFLRSQGYSDLEIAERLNLTVNGVQTSFRRHYDKHKIGRVPQVKAS